MRNASGHQGENENTEQEHMHTTSTERVTRKFLEVSRCCRAKQRQRNVGAIFFLPLKHIAVAFYHCRCLHLILSITRFHILL